jgi:hypothetical protein
MIFIDSNKTPDRSAYMGDQPIARSFPPQNNAQEEWRCILDLTIFIKFSVV